MQYKALIFDLDDTLFDFGTSEAIGLEHVYNVHFSAHIEKGPYLDTYHVINKDLWGKVDLGQLSPVDVKLLRFQQLAEKNGLKIDHMAASMAYDTVMSESVIWLEGAEEAVEIFKPHFKLGIISNSVNAIQVGKCHRAGVYRWCQCVLISEQVGLAKPDPRIFRLACERLGVQPSETLMIGDSLSADYQGAMNVGMDFCWVNPEQKPLPAKYSKPKFEVMRVGELPELLGLTH